MKVSLAFVAFLFLAPALLSASAPLCAPLAGQACNITSSEIHTFTDVPSAAQCCVKCQAQVGCRGGQRAFTWRWPSRFASERRMDARRANAASIEASASSRQWCTSTTVQGSRWSCWRPDRTVRAERQRFWTLQGSAKSARDGWHGSEAPTRRFRTTISSNECWSALLQEGAAGHL